MFFRYYYWFLPILLLTIGCATGGKRGSQSLSDNGYFTQFKQNDPYKNNLALGESESSAVDYFTREDRVGYYLLDPDDQTWKAHYYFFRIRDHIYQDLVDELPSTEQEIPVVLNDKVQKYINYYQNRGRKTFTRWLERSGKFIPMMTEILQDKNLPSDLVYLAMIESGFNVKARSPMGAVGPWQFIRPTGKKYGLTINSWVDERMNPEKSTVAAANYLKDLYNMFESWELAAAGYNAGEMRVQRAIDKYNNDDFWEMSRSRKALPRETREYVPKIVAALIIVKNPEKYGFTQIDYHEPQSYEIASVPPQKSLRDIARVINVDYRNLRELNPSLIRNATPPGSSYYLKVPVGYAKIILEEQSDLYALKNFNTPVYLTYKVRRGDTLGGIARRYRTSVSSIRKKNKLRSNLIRVGQRLRIPTRYSGTASYAKSSGTQKSGSYNAASNPLYHKVRKGDTVGGISSKYRVSIKTLKSANKLRSNTIYPGQKLIIPGRSGYAKNTNSHVASKATTHRVRRGDTLSGIAARYHVSIHSLKRENKIRGTMIRPGQILRLPTKVYAKSSSGKSNLISYNVRRGDNLWNIARKHNVSVSSIKKWNNLKSSRLDTGDILKIYVK
jgi:membrane-bound lytic murein transglycosylase D